MLTKKQKNLLLFINKRIRSTGISPSHEEMKNALSLKSKSGIHRLISALVERGFIRRLAHKARALEVLKLPETASANDIYNSLSGNFTVKQITQMIQKYKKKISIKFVKTKIMNQLSYHVENKKIRDKGLILNASIQSDIKETLNLFKNIKF